MTEFNRRQILAGGAAAGAAIITPSGRAWAQARDQVIRIGVLADFSGPYRSTSGPTSLAAAQQAVDDLGLTQRGIRVEVLQGDHQNRPDAALALARRWIDQEGVDMLCEVNNSAIALAVANLVKEKDKVQLASGAASSALTGAQCSTHTIQWTYDTWMFSNVVGAASVRAGGDTWFMITADYAFGHQLERDVTQFVQRAGGRMLGSARYPFPGTTDFSSFLLQAQSSRAKVVGLANAGTDTVNAIKQAAEFGLMRRGQRLVGMFVNITDVRALGLAAAAGVVTTEAWYWDQNDETRAFARRFWGAVTHYLKAVQAAGTDAAAPVMAKMRETPINDFMTKNGSIRVDGRVIRDMYLMRAKKPADARGEWDLLEVAQTIPGNEAFRPLSEGGCPLVRG